MTPSPTSLQKIHDERGRIAKLLEGVAQGRRLLDFSESDVADFQRELQRLDGLLPQEDAN